MEIKDRVSKVLDEADRFNKGVLKFGTQFEDLRHIAGGYEMKGAVL